METRVIYGSLREEQLKQRKRANDPGGEQYNRDVTPCMPCSFGLLPHPRSGTGGQPNSFLQVTVADRWIPLVTAAYGTWVARPARTTNVCTLRRWLQLGQRARSVLATTASWTRAQ